MQPLSADTPAENTVCSFYEQEANKMDFVIVAILFKMITAAAMSIYADMPAEICLCTVSKYCILTLRRHRIENPSVWQIQIFSQLFPTRNMGRLCAKRL
jgi:hypothetical protein